MATTGQQEVPMADRERSRLATLASVVPLDRRAAVGATVLAACTLVAFLGLQVVVTAAVTSGDQPMASVGEVPVQPQANAWEDAPSQTVTLHAQQMAVPYGGGSTDQVEVRALTNGSTVAFRLAWSDPTHDANLGAPHNYSDAAAVMFGTGELPPITMGAVGEPVNIWYWRAAWKANESAYGSGDMYSYNYEMAGTNAKPGNAAGNPLSKARYDRFAQNYYAEGFGSTSYAPSQPVQAKAARTEDGWAVTFERERTAEGEFDVQFDTNEDIYVAFAVWNGSADEVNGQKSITLQYSKLDPETGQLSAVETTGGDGSSGDGGDGASDGSSGDQSGSGNLVLPGFVFVLTLALMFVWFAAYWRLAEQ